MKHQLKYPFVFSECPLTDNIMEKLGFSDWWGGSGDFSESVASYGESCIRMYCNEEKDDENDGYGYSPAWYCPKRYYAPNSGYLYFLHDLVDWVQSNVSESDFLIFLEKCRSANLMPFVNSYFEHKNDLRTSIP